jgi:hypothetical protein
MAGPNDLRFLECGTLELENYLLSKELYYPLGAHLPQLTLGAILLASARAGGKALHHQQRIETVHAKWQAAWDVKTEREVHARGRLWMNYLTEYRADSKSEARVYPQNVHNRAILTLLGNPHHEADAFLHSVFKPGRFVWDEECEMNFTRHEYWYLFGTVKE